jgi:hypothetical protein
MRNGSAPAESPVFVDRSGTRRRWFVGFGIAGASLLAVSILALVAGFLGGGPGRLPGLPGLPAPAGPAARQVELGTTASSATGSIRSTQAGATPSHGATLGSGAPPGPAPAPAPVPTPTPTSTRHGNAPPHPSHSR